MALGLAPPFEPSGGKSVGNPPSLTADPDYPPATRRTRVSLRRFELFAGVLEQPLLCIRLAGEEDGGTGATQGAHLPPSESVLNVMPVRDRAASGTELGDPVRKIIPRETGWC